MAVTWNATVTPLNVARKEASVIGVRTDDTIVDDVKVETHVIQTAILDTAAQKTAVVDQLWQMHLDAVARQEAISIFVATLESQAKTNLEARE